VDEELVGVQRAGGVQHARLAVPHRDVGKQLADLGLGHVTVGAVPAVVHQDPDRPRRDGVVGGEVDQLAPGPHLGGRVRAEGQVPPVDDEAARDGPGGGQRGRDGLVGPAAAAQEQAARGGAHRAADDGAAADDLAAQVRGPFLMLFGEGALAALVT
jgi:hypothetical protein